jgi:WD40 repeat protein
MKLIRFFILFIFVSSIAVSYGCTVEPAPGLVRDIQEEFITAIDFDSWQAESLRISPDSKIVAYTKNIGNQQAVVVNGEQQKLYDEVNGYYLVYSANSEHFAYPARIGDDWYMVGDDREEGPYEELAFIYIPLFNVDGSRIIYQIKKEDKFYVVIDGQENGPYDEVKYIDLVVFSPDGKRYAYAARTGDIWSLMSDGEEIGQYQEINSLSFSPDSKHLAFSVTKDNKGVMVYDKTELGAYDEISSPIFSPDSERLTYVYRKGNELFLVLDGQQSNAYVDIDSPAFSPDSKQFAYKAQLANGNWVMVVNGVEIEEQVFLGVPIFSPDSQRLAYMVHDGEHAYVILDGEEGPKFKDIGYTSILFSPDSSRVAYLALISGVPEVHEHEGEEAAHEHEHEELGRYAVVVDGIPSREWNGVGEESIVGRSSITFSPDSKEYAYIAIDDNWKYVVVHNDKASQPFDDIGSVLTFTPDSQALIYIAYMDDGLHMFVNDDSGPVREAILTLYGGELNFEADNAFSYLIFQGDKVFDVEETLISTE